MQVIFDLFIFKFRFHFKQELATPPSAWESRRVIYTEASGLSSVNSQVACERILGLIKEGTRA